MMSDYITCSECGLTYENGPSMHGCQGSSDDRMTALEQRVSELEERCEQLEARRDDGK